MVTTSPPPLSPEDKRVVSDSQQSSKELVVGELIRGSLTVIIIIDVRIVVIPTVVLCAQDLVDGVDSPWLGDGQVLGLTQIQRGRRCTLH